MNKFLNIASGEEPVFPVFVYLSSSCLLSSLSTVRQLPMMQLNL